MGSLRMTRKVAPRLLLHGFLILLSFIYLLPFLWMISTSLKGPEEYFAKGFDLIPNRPEFGNYVEVFERAPFARFYWNTILVTALRVVAQVILASLAGYALARFEFRGKSLLFVAILAILMIPPPATVIPNFVIVRNLGWVNTYAGLVVPTIFSAYGIFLFRQFFLTLPQDLIYAAVIDGCQPWGVFWHVGVPAARAHIAAFALLVTLYSWNEFLWALVIVNDTDMRVLSVGLKFFIGRFTRIDWGVMMAAAGTSIVPVLIVFGIAQKYVIEGITLTGLKG
jgi:multiple sugar transport system permease protein